MLYRFRQAKAMEMGLSGGSGERRPRMASSCKDLRSCERWRGEILREISRKVTKIQDYGLSDYEVRDLNDEINKLMREKGHWENQIVALGGANYKRVAVRGGPRGGAGGADGREVPGGRGYKYFGRAKELPGVKELLERKKPTDDEDSAGFKRQRITMFNKVGPEYYGEMEAEFEEMVSKAEREAEQEEWQDAIADVADMLGADPEALEFPSMPTPDYVTLHISQPPQASTSAASAEGPSASESDVPPPPPPPEDEDAEPTEDSGTAAHVGEKRKASESADGATKAARTETAPSTAASASSVNRIYTVLTEEDLRQPQLPSLQDLEKFLVQKQKEELLKEFA